MRVLKTNEIFICPNGVVDKRAQDRAVRYVTVSAREQKPANIEEAVSTKLLKFHREEFKC